MSDREEEKSRSDADELAASFLEQEFADEFDDEEDQETVNVIAVAKNVNEPIPALRQVRAQLVNLSKERDSKDSDGKDVPTLLEPESVVVLEDHEGLSGKPAVLSPIAFKLATLFDGKRSASAAVTEFERRYGQRISPDQALSLQNELDRTLFLYSRRFERALKRHIRVFLDNETRPAVHAGTSYPAEAETVRETLYGFFSDPKGPGALDKSALDNPNKELASGQTAQQHETRAIMMPHIDLNVGGVTYAHGYADLLKHSQVEVFFVLGVTHQAPAEGLYYVSTKDFETPLGVVKTQRGIARRLQTAAGVETSVAELAHRTEHSVEFQALLLQGILKEHAGRNVEIVPILCGSTERFILQNLNPLNDPEFLRFTDKLRAELEACRKKWCVLCSVDLSHVGPEFGHSTMITDQVLPPIERGDRRLLAKLEACDANGFYQEIARTENSRHVDAVLAMLTMLKATEGLLKKGHLLHYNQLLKRNTHSAVSYAAMSFSVE